MVLTENMSGDPILQPYRLKHLTLRNRLMSTAHEPSYSEDGMPKERYRLYHAEKAKGGIALTMTAGSAIVSQDSPPAFGNLHAYDDGIVPWLKDLADACHEHGSAVMIQLTHLGRRTNWNKADWLPVVAPSAVRAKSISAKAAPVSAACRIAASEFSGRPGPGPPRCAEISVTPSTRAQSSRRATSVWLRAGALTAGVLAV